MMKRLLFLVLMPLGWGACPASWSGFYQFCLPLTIDHTKVPNTDQTSFPVLISITNANLKTTGNGGKVTSSSGFDIIPTSSPGVSQLNCESKLYVASTGQIIIWANVATVSHTADTQFYLLFGNSAVTTTQCAATATWDANFIAVYHFDNSLELTDSTSDAYTLSNLQGGNAPCAVTCPASTTGQIGNGVSYPGTNGFLAKISGVTSFTFPFTLQCWVNGGLTAEGAVFSYNSGSSNNGYRLDFLTNITSLSPQYVRGGIAVTSYNSITFPTSTWSLIALTANSAGTTVIGYVGTGGSFTSQTQTGVGNTLNNTPLNQVFLGSRDNVPLATWMGSADECRFSNLDRSSDWLNTEYNNENSPGTFMTVGALQPNGALNGFAPYKLKAVTL